MTRRPFESERLDEAAVQAQAATAERAVDLLDRTHLPEALDTADKRKMFFRSLDFDTFRDFLIRVNGISRGIPIHEREFDGKDVVLDAGVFGVQATPDYEDKETLLREIYQAAQEMDDPEDAALLLGAGVNAAHPFTDGNGRTSRLVFALVRDGYAGTTEERQKLIGLLSASGRKSLDVSPGHLRPQLIARQKEEARLDYLGNPTLVEWDNIREAKFPDAVPPERRERFIRMIEDGHDDFALLAIHEYVLKSLAEDRHDESFVQTSKDEFDGREKEGISVTKLIPHLTEQDVEEILARNRRLKSDYIRLLADVIKHPDQYPFPDPSGWNDYSNLKEYFLHEVKKKEYFKQKSEQKE